MDKAEMEKIFSVAIGREAKAYEFYRDVAAKMTNDEVKKVFQQLADEELGHREQLETLLHDPTKVMQFNPPGADYKVAEATDPEPLSLDMKPKDAIALAMKKELEAVNFYKGLSAAATDAGLKQMFDNLANMELNHKARLETVFVEIGYPEVF